MKSRLCILLITLMVLFALLSIHCGDDDDDENASPTPDDDDDNDDNDDDNDDDDTPPSDVVTLYEDGDDLVLENRLVQLRYHLDLGRFTISGQDREPVIEKALAMAQTNVLVPKYFWKTDGMTAYDWEGEETTNILGQGITLTIYFRDDLNPRAPELAQTFTILDGQSLLLSDVAVVNVDTSAMNIGAIYPLRADPPGGTFWFGKGKDIRVLTNGAYGVLEFMTPMFHGEVGSISNWSVLVYNNRTEKSFNVGHLTYEKALPVVYTGPSLGDFEGRALHVDSPFEPALSVAPGESLKSELMILDFQQETPFDALEIYADRIKAWLGIQTWLDKHPEIGVPVGWNSWSGSSSSGGYGTDIDEAIIVDNMEFADRELRRWGMNYFQIDDGWQTHTGDWEVRTDRFPDHGSQNGIEWLLDRAKGLGFYTGLWWQGFNASKHSDVYLNHPEYMADPFLWGLVETEICFDLTKPDARNYLTGIIDNMKSWGIEWLKLDFAYTEFMTANWYDSNITRGGYYRSGIEMVRQALGDDIFFLNVAITGYSLGFADSIRLTLDTMPAWDGEKPESPTGNQGLKPMYRDSVRRYHLHGRVWVNHPDLIFFRAHKDTSIPPLTLNESLTFATSVAMQGGLVKIGDRIVDLTPEAVDGYRRIMPPYGISGRPLDMFEREFPEVFSLPVNDFDEPYHVVAFLNWGSNRDLSVWPTSWMADADRDISLSLDRAGLDPYESFHAYEFWEEKYLGKVSGVLSQNVPARHPRVISLHENLGRPQFLGTNRHVLQGVKVVDSIVWDAGSYTLTGVQEASVGTSHAPFEFHLAFFAPTGYDFENVSLQPDSGITVDSQNSTVTAVDGGNLIDVYFSLSEDAPPQPGDQFKKITWVLSFE